MGHTLEQFASTCHDILKAEPGPEGRQKICSLLSEVLTDANFVQTNLGDDVPERKVIYEDPELGFCILAHVNRGAKESPPHDHGPTWAIYGQAKGETEMSEWQVVSPATSDTPGTVRRTKVYTMTPGSAYVYNEGDLHSPRRWAETRLIRFEGKNMDGIKRLAYRAE